MSELRDNLERIRELSAHVSPFKNIADVHKDIADYKCIQGEVTGRNLFNIKGIAVQLACAGEHSILTPHSHDDSTEIVVAYEGHFTVWINGEGKEYKTGDVCVILPKTGHIFETKSGCKLIAITIPSAEGYPQ
jgi:quercetin dioxygenase-like cupin family protein